MAAAVYLEQYLDCLETLPAELQRNFQLMRQLDEKSEEMKVFIDKLTEEYISDVKDLAPAIRLDRIKKIQELYAKCQELAEDKVQIAAQTYKMVDKHIQNLDSDLARFEADLKDKSSRDAANNSTSNEEEQSVKDKKKRCKKATVSKDQSELNKKKQKHGEHQPSASFSLPYANSDVLDMPIDPNEPTYCSCHQVSYGEMIGCDNPDCPIEWFHFGCVDLTSKPKGKWFCSECRKEKEMKKK